MCRHTEKYGFKITSEVRNPAENILNVHMDGGDTRVPEQAAGFCATPSLSCNQDKKHNPGMCLLRGLWLYPHCSVRSLATLKTSKAPLVICHLQAEHCTEPSRGCPRAQIASLFLSSVDWSGLGLEIHISFLTSLWC